jgi:hypothetical membrane protein
LTASSRTRALALTGIVGPICSTALIVVQGVLHPEYSHVKLPISALAAWPLGWIQNLNFYVSGVLIVLFVVALHGAVRPTPRGRAGVALLLIGGVALAMNGAFPWRMIDGVPTEPPAHAASAITTFASTGVGMIVFSRRMNADVRWRRYAAYSLWSGILVLILFVIVGFFAVDNGAPLHEWTGLIQRVLVAVWLAWMIVLALAVRADVRSSDRHSQ